MCQWKEGQGPVKLIMALRDVRQASGRELCVVEDTRVEVVKEECEARLGYWD